MTLAPELVLVGAVFAVGVLHTMVPDHWVPIAVIARQRGWSRRETAFAAAKAGGGHVASTLAIGVVVWIAGVQFATRFGQTVSLASSIALVAFGVWIAVAALREMRAGHGHHDHAEGHDHGAPPAATNPTSSRTALLLILGSSPMVEGIPAFFAAGKYGPGLIAVMALVFASSTIATYVALCVSSAAGLQRLRLGALENYGEVLSGGFIAAVGVAFFFFPAL